MGELMKRHPVVVLRLIVCVVHFDPAEAGFVVVLRVLGLVPCHKVRAHFKLVVLRVKQ
jgi:hypothetical protein